MTEKSFFNISTVLCFTQFTIFTQSTVYKVTASNITNKFLQIKHLKEVQAEIYWQQSVIFPAYRFVSSYTPMSKWLQCVTWPDPVYCSTTWPINTVAAHLSMCDSVCWHLGSQGVKFIFVLFHLQMCQYHITANVVANQRCLQITHLQPVLN